MIEEIEIWKPIRGWIRYYEVSNFGRVRSKDRHTDCASGARVFYKGRVLKTPLNNKGYPCGAFSKLDKYVTYRVHRLVAEAFVIKPRNKPHVNHIDGDPTNNHHTNLEWCTPGENQAHGYRIGLRPPGKGVLNGNSKLTEVEVREIRRLRETGISSRKLQKMFPQVSRRAIMCIYLGHSWKHLL